MGDKVYSVTQLNKSIRKVLLERSAALRDVWIEGEISGWKVYQSGHAYFTLKDAESQVSCVLFSFNFANCQRAFTARVAGGGAGAADGLKVQVRGELDLYMPRGACQFKILQVRIAGVGDLMARFQELKEKLQKEITQVYVCYSGQGVHSVHNEVSRLFESDHKIVKEDIDGIYDENINHVYEGHRILDAIPQEFSVGTQKLLDAVGVLSSNVTGRYLNIIAKSKLLNYLENCFQKVVP